MSKLVQCQQNGTWLNKISLNQTATFRWHKAYCIKYNFVDKTSGADTHVKWRCGYKDAYSIYADCKIWRLRDAFTHFTNPIDVNGIRLTSSNATPTSVDGRSVVSFQIQGMTYSQQAYFNSGFGVPTTVRKRFFRFQKWKSCARENKAWCGGYSGISVD